MFRKPIRTYERKKGILSRTTIIREDVPPDRDAETVDSVASGDESINDPFDTTFDRIAKTAKMPPKPPVDDSRSLYDDSSSSGDEATRQSDIPPIPLPLIDPGPVSKRQRVFRRRKIEENSFIKVTGRLKKPTKRLGRSSWSLNDENTKPRDEKTAAGNELVKNKDAKSHEKIAKKQQVSKKRTPMAVYRGRIQRSLDNSKSQRDSDESPAVSNVENDDSDNETQENQVSAIRDSEKTDENNEDRFSAKKTPNIEVFAAKPAIIVDGVATPKFEKRAEIFKNPTVSLTRLNLPRRSDWNKSWLSSTPLMQRAAKKSVLHFSPINRNESTMIGLRHGDENSGEASWPPKSSDQDIEPAESRSSKDSQEAKKKTDGNTEKKRKAIVLSASPAAEPSCLMFDDSEAAEEHYSSAAPKENSYAAGSSAPNEKFKNTTEASSTSLLKGFSIGSSDPESLHLQYDAADKTESSSENLVQYREKTKSTSLTKDDSSVDDDNHRDSTKPSTSTRFEESTHASSDAECAHSKINDEDTHSQDENSKKSDKDSSSIQIHDSVDSIKSKRIQRRTAPSQKSLDIAEASTNVSAKDTSEKFDSDGEWTTIPGSPEADSNISTEKNVSSKDSSKASEHRGRNSIEQLSSNDENISSDDIAVLVNANDQNGFVGSFPVDEKIAGLEDANGNEAETSKPSVIEPTNNRDSLKDNRRELMQPVVLLERLDLPIGKTKKNAAVRKTKVEIVSKSIESAHDLPSSSNDGNVSDIETSGLARKSRKIKKAKKPNANNRSNATEINRNPILISDDDSVFSTKKPVPSRKSRKSAVTGKTKVTNRSDSVEKFGDNLTPQAADRSASDAETRIPGRKSRKIIKVKNRPDKKALSQNSILSLTDSVSSNETPVSARKSRRNTMTEKTPLAKASDTMESSQNSTLSSADGSVSRTESPVPARKSRKNTMTEKTPLIKASDMMESTQNSTLSSTDGSVSRTESPVPARKSRKNTMTEKTPLVKASDMMESTPNSTHSSTDGSVSRTESPVPIRKSRKNAIGKKGKAVNRSDTVESPALSKKLLKTRRANKRRIKTPSPSPDSSQNLSSSSADNRNSDTETPGPTEKSKSTRTAKSGSMNHNDSDRSDAMESSKNSTLSSVDDNVSDNGLKVPVKKSRKNMTKKTKLINRSDSEESSRNLTVSSTDEIPTPIKNSRKSTRASKRSIKTPSRTSDSSHNSTSSSLEEGASDNDELVPVKKPRKISQAKRLSTADFPSANAELETTENDESAGDSEASVVNETAGNATEALESSEIEVSQRRDSSEVSSPHSITEEIKSSRSSRSSRSSSAETEDMPVEGTQNSDKKSPPEERSVVKTDENPNRPRLSLVQPVVLLNRLNDPVRVSLRRRKKYSNLYSQLNAIPENLEGKSLNEIEEVPEENEPSQSARFTEIREPPTKLSGEVRLSQQTTASCRTSILSDTIDESRLDRRESRLLYLKPGKSWARSLSILSNVHSQEDLESLAVGKGKKWRQSVNNILQMQQQGLLQSCVKKNEDDKESQSFSGVRSSAAAWNSESSQSDTSRVLSASSPGRFVRRVSIRVVPDRTSVERIEDTPFREAYGITALEDQQTIGKRSTSIVPRKTLVYNVQDVSYDNIPRNINTIKSRDVVLRQCCQESSLPFEECYPLSYLRKCRKIGEGVYGEVFLHENDDEKTVIKIIPIEGNLDVNNERQKRFDEILSEIVIAKELHNLRYAQSSNTSSFVEVKNIRCVFGRYPQKLIELWNAYDEEKNSENDCPAMFDDNQLYIVLELGHGGEDLEAFVFQNAAESHALFMQTAVALAVAEEKLDFEHRDLHWGNVLIARTDQPHVEYKLRDKTIRLVSKGVKVSVIDFTLSRMSYQGCSIFNDLSMDEDLFVAQGEYQFEIYRLMRQKVENDWQRFEPFTNVLWLHYTLDKMITAARYRRKASKIHSNSIEKLCELKDTILNYKSAFDFVTNCDKATRLQGSRTSVNTVP